MAEDVFRGAVVAAHGPLAVEARLLADLAAHTGAPRLVAHTDASGFEPLARPLRIVVPSHSLREHLVAQCVRRARGALAGVGFHTLHGLALAILERAHRPPPRGGRLFGVLVARFARAEPALARALAHLDASWPAVESSVADLFDAGFEPASEPALLATLAAATGISDLARDRARALVRTAAATARASSAAGLCRRSDVLRRAAQTIADDPNLLAAHAVWIHGFAEAQGVELELLAALRDHCCATIYFDTAAMTCAAQDSDGVIPKRRAHFGAHLQERLGVGVGDVCEPASAAPTVHMSRAPGLEAEARAVAFAIAALIEGGVEPEMIGVVAGDLDTWRLALRVHFDRLGIPFSGFDARGSVDPAERRARAFVDLLRRGGDLPVERWLDLALAPTAARGFDLLLAVRALGAGRLQRLAELDLAAALGPRQSYALPVRLGSHAEDEIELHERVHDGGSTARRAGPQRRTIARSDLERAREHAQLACARWHGAPDGAPFAAHAGALRAWIEDLGWRADSADAFAVDAALGKIEDDVPEDFVLARGEFVDLFDQAVSHVCARPLGGAGAGVQCRSLSEASAHTFLHVFGIGLNQGELPLAGPSDPLLGDDLRKRLSSQLPALALRARSRDRQQFLFEQLLRSSPSVVLSWQTIDEDGKARQPSPFVERLGPPGHAELVAIAPSVFGAIDPTSSDSIAARPAHEEVVLAGLYGTREDFASILPLALAETRGQWRSAAIADLAHARVAILREYDPPPSDHARLGPYFGFLGALADAQDLRRGEVFVTTLERMAGCPWQTFLTKILHIESAPDPLDGLPAVDARSIGLAVHAVLGRIARASRLATADERVREDSALERAVDLGSWIDARPCKMAWPSDARLEALLHDAAREVLRAQGIGLRGLEQVIVEAARPLVHEARAIDRAQKDDGRVDAGLLGAEIEGSTVIDGDGGAPARVVRFIVDRVDRRGSSLVLTDYKTGKPISDRKKPATRARAFLNEVGRGRHLQAAIYARAAGENGAGRYLFLQSDIDADAREFTAAAGDGDLAATALRATRSIFRAWDAGSFFPRLLDDDLVKEHPSCARCEVSQACIRGDSGARHRLASFVEHARANTPESMRASAAERAWIELWDLGRARTDGSIEGSDS